MPSQTLNQPRIFYMGYKNCAGWFGYIPPRHKKRAINFLKKKNQGKRKDHPLYVTLSDIMAIYPQKTVLYV